MNGQHPVLRSIIPFKHLVIDVVLPIGHLRTRLELPTAQHRHVIGLQGGYERMPSGLGFLHHLTTFIVVGRPVSGDAGHGSIHAQLLVARVKQMLVSEAAFKVLPVESDVSLTRTIEVLEVVHPRQSHLEIGREDVLRSGLVLDIEASILAAGPLGGVYQLVHPGASGNDLSMQFALNQIILVLSVVVEAHAPAVLVIVQGQVAVQESVEAVVERGHRGEHIRRLLPGYDIDDAAGTLRVILHVRTGHDLDALHIGRRNTLQAAKSGRNPVHQDKHVAVAPDGNPAVAVHAHGRCPTDHFQHGPCGSSSAGRRIDARLFHAHALRRLSGYDH